MYATFTPLDALKESAFRIFDPFAYKLVHDIRFVPVGLGEATTLARLFPIVWIPNLIGTLHPVVVLRLRAEGGLGAPPPGVGLRALPHLLQAYPFRLRDFDARDFAIGIERILPAQERDSGSYVFDATGELLPGARLKLAALERFVEGQEVLQNLTLKLQEHSLFEPVQIPTGYSISPPPPAMFAALEMFDVETFFEGFPAAHIQPATTFLVAQRMSLYRMHQLLQKVKGADKDE